MKFWDFWSEMSVWNRVGLACVAAAVILALIFMTS